MEDSVPNEVVVYKPTTRLRVKLKPRRVPPKIRRNSLCPCGSGKKYKKCCWIK